MTRFQQRVRAMEDETNADRIDVDDPENVAYWARQFRISTVEVKFVVVKAGPEVAAVRKLLRELGWLKHEQE